MRIIAMAQKRVREDYFLCINPMGCINQVVRANHCCSSSCAVNVIWYCHECDARIYPTTSRFDSGQYFVHSYCKLHCPKTKKKPCKSSIPLIITPPPAPSSLFRLPPSLICEPPTKIDNGVIVDAQTDIIIALSEKSQKMEQDIAKRDAFIKQLMGIILAGTKRE